MTAFQPGDRFNAPAGEDLSAKRYYIVKLNSDGEVILATAATDAILGVLDNAPEEGQTADVVLLNGCGTFKVKTGGNISKDAYVTTNGSGLAIATTTTGNRVIGRAVATTLSGDVGEYIKSNEKY
jgi:hypothetical protein